LEQIDGRRKLQGSIAGDGKLFDDTYADPGAKLVRNFIDCVKLREMPIVSLEEGHLSTNMVTWQQFH